MNQKEKHKKKTTNTFPFFLRFQHLDSLAGRKKEMLKALEQDTTIEEKKKERPNLVVLWTFDK